MCTSFCNFSYISYAFLLSLFYQTIGPIDSSNSSSSRKLRLRQMFKLSLNRKEKSFRINQSSTLDLKAFTSVAFTMSLGNLFQIEVILFVKKLCIAEQFLTMYDSVNVALQYSTLSFHNSRDLTLFFVGFI